MTDTERLIEAIEYADDMGMEWWEVFDTKTEAEDILNGAFGEEPDEYSIVQLTNLIGISDDDFYTTSQEIIFRKCLKTLKRRMNKEY